MQVHLKIGEFAKLSGVTVKTILYYHKIGLLAEPARSAGGYRLYGTDDLKQMLTIKRLKSLGLRLEEIKTILGHTEEPKSTREVLLSLQAELLNRIKTMKEQLTKIEDFLDQDNPALVEGYDDPSSFKMILDILGEEAKTDYRSICPELYEQERKLYQVMDELQWGFNYQDLLREIAEYFKEHPEQYQQSLLYGSQITAIVDLPEDSPVIEDLARDYGAFLKTFPFWEKAFNQESGVGYPLELLMTEMFTEVLGPAQMKLAELLRQYLISGKSAGETETGD